MTMNRFTFLILAFLTCTLWADCKKNDEDTGCDTNFLEAEINGSKWVAPKVTTLSSGYIRIFGRTDDSVPPSFNFDLPLDIPTGPYDLTQSFSLIFYPEGGGVYAPRSGTLNVTTHDTTARILRGTFEFVTEPANFVIKNGSFCVKY